MSKVFPSDIVNASRWTAVALTVAECLKSRATASESMGALAAIQRFFKLVEAGIKANRREDTNDVNRLTAISSLTVAYEVWAALGTNVGGAMGAEQRIKHYAKLIDSVFTAKQLSSRPADYVELISFLEELFRQGQEIERDEVGC